MRNKMLKSRYGLINYPYVLDWAIFEEFITYFAKRTDYASIPSKIKRLFTHNKALEKVRIIKNIVNTHYWVLDRKSNKITKLPFIDVLKTQISLILTTYIPYFTNKPNKIVINSTNNGKLNSLFLLLDKRNLFYKVHIYKDTKIISINTDYIKIKKLEKYNIPGVDDILKPLAVYKEIYNNCNTLKNCILVFNYNLIRSLLLTEYERKENVIAGIICLPFYEDIRVGFMKALNYLETDNIQKLNLLTCFKYVNPVVLMQTVFKTKDIGLLKIVKEILPFEGNVYLQRFFLLETLHSLNAVIKQKENEFDLMQEMIKSVMKSTFNATLKEDNIQIEIETIYKDVNLFKTEDSSEDFRILLNQFCNFLKIISNNKNL